MIRFGTTRKAPTEDEAGSGEGEKTMAGFSPKGYVTSRDMDGFFI